MTHQKALLVVGLVSMAVLASTALGGAPMGPPMALLGEGNVGFGGEYGHESMDLRQWDSLGGIRRRALRLRRDHRDRGSVDEHVLRDPGLWCVRQLGHLPARVPRMPRTI